MNLLRTLARRIRTSAVFWSWAFNLLRLASGIFLLPLLLRKLPKPEFGMYYVFLSVTGLQMVLDFGFASTIGRFVAYAMAGAKTIQAQGLGAPPAGAAQPNYALLWRLVRTARTLYRYIAMVSFVVMGVWGTVLVHSKVGETASPSVTWMAWGITLTSATLDMYTVWWNNVLYYMNQVRESSRICFWSYATRMLLACGLLLGGGGLLSVPLAGIAGSLLNRYFTRRKCLRLLGQAPAGVEQLSQGSLLHLLWPNSWRLGLQLLSNYLRTNASTAICVSTFGLVATAQYGLSVQIMNVAVGMASVWTAVKWPAAGQLHSAHNLAGLRALLWPRMWLQIVTFLVLSLGAVFAGPFLLHWIKTDKQMLPTPWMVLMMIGALLDLTYGFWSTLLAVENKIPTLRSAVLTNVASLILAYGLCRWAGASMLALVVAPLVTGMVYLHWHWPRVGARSLETTWLRFMFSRPGAGSLKSAPR